LNVFLSYQDKGKGCLNDEPDTIHGAEIGIYMGQNVEMTLKASHRLGWVRKFLQVSLQEEIIL
jgi:hypothetical protein